MVKTRKPSRENVAKSAAASNVVIALPAALDTAAAATLRDTLISAVEEGTGSVVLEAEAVTRIGTPCVQVLLSAGRTLEEGGRRLALRNTAAPLKRAFADMGLANHLQRWEACLPKLQHREA